MRRTAKLHREIPAELKRQRRQCLSVKSPQEVCLEYYRVTVPTSFPYFLNISLSLSLVSFVADLELDSSWPTDGSSG